MRHPTKTNFVPSGSGTHILPRSYRIGGQDIRCEFRTAPSLPQPEQRLTLNENASGQRHKARFGEIESRGVALTPKGIDLYHALMTRAEESMTHLPHPIDNQTRQSHLEETFRSFPDDWDTLRTSDLAYFRALRGDESSETSFQARDGIRYEPVTYEDFLPASAAGIFQSNLGQQALSVSDAGPDREAFERALGCRVLDSHVLYRAEAEGSSSEGSLTRSPEFMME
jgi:uncharacterized glyoxalase superfamily metalloenzyme YdcJ